jgi:hypothetical protein
MVTGKPVHVTRFSFSYLIRTDVARAESILVRRGLASFPCLNRWLQSRGGRSASAVRHNTAEVKARPGDQSKSPSVFQQTIVVHFFLFVKNTRSTRRGCYLADAILSKIRFPFTGGRRVHGPRVFKGVYQSSLYCEFAY